MTFIAAYPGSCEECGGQLKGRESQYTAQGQLVHVKCPESDLEAPARTPLCPRCFFCYHNGECA